MTRRNGRPHAATQGVTGREEPRPVAAAPSPARTGKPNTAALVLGGIVLLALGALAVAQGTPVAVADGTVVFLTGPLTGGLARLAV